MVMLQQFALFNLELIHKMFNLLLLILRLLYFHKSLIEKYLII